MAYGSTLFTSLANRQTVAPFVQAVMMEETWPKDMILEDPYYHDSHGDDYFHPSMHALHGPKSIYETLHPAKRLLLPPEKRDYNRIMTPLMGTMYHVIIQQKLVHSGLVSPADVEIKLVDEGRHWRGHADLLFRGELVDIKTMNSRSFEFFKNPYRSWIYQLHPYMDHLGLKTCLILIVEQGMPWRMKELRINFDQAVMDEIYEKWDSVRHALSVGRSPRFCCKPADSKYCPIDCGGLLQPRVQ